MKFYVSTVASSNIEYPCLVLKHDSWDDYSFKTLFSLSFYTSPTLSKKIGTIKIMSLDGENGYDQHGYVKLPESFEKLSESFCSLGQDFAFYNTLKIEFGEDYESILDALNDSVMNQGILEEFEGNHVFKVSLIRFSEAEKALRQGRRMLSDENVNDPFDFSFSCKVGSASENHEASFSFSGDSSLPERIIAIIGNNGTGKTQYLAKMALALSGEKVAGTFEPFRPSFSKIITVSYSAFDKFERPSKKRSFSYIYCGLKDMDGFLTAKKLENRYETSAAKITTGQRERFWITVLKNIIDEEQLATIYDDLFEKKIYSRVAHNNDGFLSSGQSILMYVVTEVLANIRDESLILFDEPEMHLHPNAIAKLIKMINVILKQFNSYAILATHSPIVLQEIPSKCVRVFEREGSVPWVRSLDIESFGENLNVITKHVFETVNTRSNYKDVLKLLATDRSFEEINELFSGRLSLNASIYLQGLYRDKN